MNAERLHSIALAMKTDLTQTNIVKHLQDLVTALQNQINQPNQPEYQQQVGRFHQSLRDALNDSAINAFSPTWRQVIEELEVESFLGNNLEMQIAAIFSANQITPSLANEQLQKLLTSLQALTTSLDQLLASFSQLKIGAEELDPGECEIGVLVPRAFVDNRLDKFSDELGELNKIFGVFEELCTGSRPSPKIRTISSSELSIFLETAPVVGACIAAAVERVIAMYRQLLEIRKLQGELAKQGIEKEDLKGIEKHANGVMEKGIDTLVKELVSEFSAISDVARKNEISIELKFALKKIANRVDRGFNIEVKMQEPTEASDGDPVADGANNTDIAKHHAKIQGAAGNLQFLKLDGDPILSLSEEAVEKKK